MDIKPVEQVDTRVNIQVMDDITEFFESLAPKEEEDTEDLQELNFED